MKKIFQILILFYAVNSLFSGDVFNSKEITDRSRILLSISYYEVAVKYRRMGKTQLADQYMANALRLEKNVEKYYNGKLKIPAEKSRIDWHSIFNTGEKLPGPDEGVSPDHDSDGTVQAEYTPVQPSDTEQDDNLSTNDQTPREQSGSKPESIHFEPGTPEHLVYSFFNNIATDNFPRAIDAFRERVLFSHDNTVMTGQVLLNHFRQWKDANPGDTRIEELADIQNMQLTYKVEPIILNQLNLELSQYYQADLIIHDPSLLPGSLSSRKYILLIYKDEDHNLFKIAAVGQMRAD